MAPNFEYYTITETNPTDATETAHILNHLGYLGWDLAATFSNPLGTHFVLKRPFCPIDAPAPTDETPPSPCHNCTLQAQLDALSSRLSSLECSLSLILPAWKTLFGK